MKKIIKSVITLACLFCLFTCQTPTLTPGWPGTSRESKPWSRWWWQGNALTKEGITAEMEAYQKAGLGGLEITPIYGVSGYENKFVDFLSPQWMELLEHTMKEAERLDMGIDMATGTGWPFGGPWVTAEDACKDLNYKVYEVKGGSKLTEKIEFIQQPYLRAVGNPIFDSPDKQPRLDPRKIDIKQLVEPISQNKNLQGLALDQVKFEKPLKLLELMAYDESGRVVELTAKINASGILDWVAPEGTWKLYAVFAGWHGKMVERASPGGEGNVIDHFSSTALDHYLDRFDQAFKGTDLTPLRSFFNDSYEVDDARGTADWTPALFDEFMKMNGYDLRFHLKALFGHDSEENNRRVLCDYRETISELLLNNFTARWKSWAHKHHALVRNQAHGSPANILDLYATVDIPEIEGIEPLRIKMASSAGHVTGKKLISSESATWLNEHFQSNLSDIKIALDRFMLNGVNHIFYHGTAYSPPGEPWPGWLFYAAVHANPRNPLWEDFGTLNTYVGRCQSFLQNTTPDNDVLLYYPIYDRFSTPGNELIEHFDGISRQFAGTPFAQVAESMLGAGYAFDYISDKQINKTSVSHGKLITEGGSSYMTLVVPRCEYIPLATFQKIMSLAEEGARIVFAEGLPGAPSGFKDMDRNKKDFNELISAMGEIKTANDQVSKVGMGGGNLWIGKNLKPLEQAGIRKEKIVDLGMTFIRVKRDEDLIYFISNNNQSTFSGWLPLQAEFETAALYDPMTGNFGVARVKKTENTGEVFVQITPGQTLFIETSKSILKGNAFNYHEPFGESVAMNGKWSVSFVSGGPKLPESYETDSLKSWTDAGPDCASFSGTALYKLSFPKPAISSKSFLLDLGVVKESAKVTLNGKELGTLIGPVYRVYVDAGILSDNNVLEVKVTNLMANRISDMDRKKVFWKKFYNVNFPARKPENRKNGIFDASEWPPFPSGLLGPVTWTPVQSMSSN